MDYGIGRSIEFGNDLGGIILGIICFGISYVFYFKKKKYSIYKMILLLILFIYMTMVIGVTLTPLPINLAEVKYMQAFYDGIERYNLVPFKDIFYLNNQFLLNIILFIPFGILKPLFKNKEDLKYALVSSFIFSAFIEITQLGLTLLFQVSAWYFDVNDILANVLGGLIGYSIGKWIIKPIITFILKIEIYEEEK